MLENNLGSYKIFQYTLFITHKKFNNYYNILTCLSSKAIRTRCHDITTLCLKLVRRNYTTTYNVGIVRLRRIRNDVTTRGGGGSQILKPGSPLVAPRFS